MINTKQTKWPLISIVTFVSEQYRIFKCTPKNNSDSVSLHPISNTCHSTICIPVTYVPHCFLNLNYYLLEVKEEQEYLDLKINLIDDWLTDWFLTPNR